MHAAETAQLCAVVLLESVDWQVHHLDEGCIWGVLKNNRSGVKNITSLHNIAISTTEQKKTQTKWGVTETQKTKSSDWGVGSSSPLCWNTQQFL